MNAMYWRVLVKFRMNWPNRKQKRNMTNIRRLKRNEFIWKV